MKTAVIFASLIASTAGFAAKKAAPKAKAVVSSFEGELGVQQPVRSRLPTDALRWRLEPMTSRSRLFLRCFLWL
jgi:hypothetical protein